MTQFTKLLLGAAAFVAVTAAAAEPPCAARYGVTLHCTGVPDATDTLAYLTETGIKPEWLTLIPSDAGFTVQLRAEVATESTLAIAKNKVFAVGADVVELLDPRRAVRQVPTVSKKEILLALLHPGRHTEFNGADCGLAALQDDVGVRQTVVAWTQTLSYGWPDGGPASWNEAYWLKGSPRPGVDLFEAATDFVINSAGYSIGCYTAAKMAITAGHLDYYTRVKPNAQKLQAVTAALMRDGDPLVDIEPESAWIFDATADTRATDASGKLLSIKRDVAPLNFVPGDWIYLLNTDEKSYEKTGYEGSNAIYLGLDRFSDYYNDHEHSYSFKQKLHEVYQWRNGVFSRTRDAAKVIPLTDDDFIKLANTPVNGGLLLAHRLVPNVVTPKP